MHEWPARFVFFRVLNGSKVATLRACPERGAVATADATSSLD